MRSRAALLLLAALAGCEPATLRASLVDDRLAQPPARPAIPDAESVLPRVFALTEIVLEEDANGGWRTVGYDLDGYYTTPTAPRQACEPAQNDPVLDGEGGIDNAFGSEIAPVLSLLLPGNFEDDLAARMDAGIGTLLVRVADWNGAENDPAVQASLVQSVDGTSAAPSEVVFEDGELRLLDGGLPAPPPAWEGADAFYPREPEHVAIDEAAYVRDGVLVVRAPRLELLIATESIVGFVRLVEVTLAVSITAAGAGGDCVGATLTGRWSIPEILASSMDFGICDPSDLDTVADDAAENADLLTNPERDPRASCDAISVAFRFASCGLGAWGASVASPAPASACD